MNIAPSLRVGDQATRPGRGDQSSRRDASVEAARLVDLMDRCARGHEDAFAELYDLTSSRIYAIILRVLRSPDHAAEVTQEVYVEIWRQSARYATEKGSVMAWMTTMAHRRAVDRVRSVVQRDRPRRALRLHRHRPRGRPGLGQRRTDSSTWNECERGMASLTAIQREALTLAYFGGYTQSQVAELLKLPLGTVKTRIRDGLIGLRDALGVEA